MTILENYERIAKEVRPATLVVVGKGRPIEELKKAYHGGARFFGESKVQEGVDKFTFYQQIAAEVHMIGHLQSNKVKEAVRVFDCIQSVDSIELAKRIDAISGEFEKKILIMLQVNISNDPDKFGFKVDELENAINQIQVLPNCILVGLMTITSRENNREDFKKMKQLYDNCSIKDKYYLSMGMSDSYKVAIEEGSNMVRVGTAIFGPRK